MFFLCRTAKNIIENIKYNQKMENKGSQFVAEFVLKATSHLLAAKLLFIFILQCQTDGYEDKLLACCAAGNGLPNSSQSLKEEAPREIVSELCNCR